MLWSNRYAYAGDDPVNNLDVSGRAIGGILELVLFGLGFYSASNEQSVRATIGAFAGNLSGALCEAGVAALAPGTAGLSLAGPLYA